MYPVGPYAFSRGSFQTPVVPPTTQPDADPRQAVCVNQAWLPLIVGALKQLELQSTWKVADDIALLDVQGRVFNLMSMFGKDVPGCCLVPYGKMCLSGSFTDSDYGFTPTGGFSCSNTYLPGTGWISCPTGISIKRIDVGRSFGGSTFVRSFQVKGGAPFFAGTLTINISFLLSGIVVATGTQGYIGGGDFNTTFFPNINCDQVLVEVITDAAISPDLVWTDWSICYTGLYPLSATPAALFTHTFDFTLTNGLFSTVSNPTYPNTGQWISGTGWQSQLNVTGGLNEQILIIHRVSAARYITQIELFWNAASIANTAFRGIILKNAGVTQATLVLNAGSGSFDQVFNPAVLADEIEIAPTSSHTTGTSQFNVVTELIVSGQGVDPF